MIEQSEKPRDAKIVLRLPGKAGRKRKTAYVRAAQRSRDDRGKTPTLAAWIFTHLDKASGYKEQLEASDE